MSKKANSFVVGLFVLGAATLFVVGLLLFGSSSLFEDTRKVVSFFEGSVKGLRVGAAVNFRGVKIGQVVDVQLHINHDNEKVMIPVIMNIYANKVVEVGKKPEQEGQTLERMVDRGLRAQLDMESFVTGILAVNLDYHEGSEKRLVGLKAGMMPGKMKEYIEIPTRPSVIEKISSALEDLPLSELVEDFRVVIARVGELLESEDTGMLAKTLAETLEEFSKTLKAGRKLMINLDGIVVPVSDDARVALKQARVALKEIEKTFGATSEMLADGSDSRYELRELVKSLHQASDKVKDLADYLERNPDAILRGKR